MKGCRLPTTLLPFQEGVAALRPPVLPAETLPCVFRNLCFRLHPAKRVWESLFFPFGRKACQLVCSTRVFSSASSSRSSPRVVSRGSLSGGCQRHGLALLHWELAHGETGPWEESLSEDVEGEQSLGNGWLLHFKTSYLLMQRSPKSRDHQAKQTQLCKTNPVTKASTGLL